jgi:dephospho-CoA kinase
MIRVGLTGGIGCGKSMVSGIFKVLGIPVFDADAATKNIMATDPVLQQRLMAVFGKAIFANGVLDRKLLASMVFPDPFKLEQLNALVHPAAIAAAEKWMEAQQGVPYAIKEAALFFEAGSAGDIDYMIGVSAPKALRIKRVMERDGVGRQEVLTRMSRQIEEDIKMRLCDVVVVNDEQQPLIPQVLAIHTHLLSL